MINRREDFGLLLNELGLIGEAVEIGTHRGAFAVALLEKWKGRVLHCVDPWENIPEFDDVQVSRLITCLDGAEDREEDFQHAKNVLSRFGDRVVLHRTVSLKFVKQCSNESIDFVYLDGNHRYKEVRRDLIAWLPKIRPGGLLAGHDIDRVEWSKEIRPAVEEVGLPINLVRQPDDPWSYFLVKPCASTE